MKNKMKFIIGSVMGIVLLFVIVTSVQAASCGIYSLRAHGSSWAKTTTATHDEGPTFNNYLFAKTLAWSVDVNGNPKYHEGPTARMYNVQSVSSTVNVPDGRGQWYECQVEGTCNRCGIHQDFIKEMFAF